LARVHAERVGKFENLPVRHYAAARVDEIVVGFRSVADRLVDILGSREVVEADISGLIDQTRVGALERLAGAYRDFCSRLS
jgi:hypothetical protein